jgi:hydrogenase/urease accessory protein HupE
VLRPQEGFLTAELSGNVQDITQIPGAVVSPSERQGDTLAESAKARIAGYVNGHLLLEQGGKPLAGEITNLRYQANLDPTLSKFSLFVRYPVPPGADASAPLVVTNRLFDYLPNAKTLLTVGSFSRAMAPGERAEVDPRNLAVNLATNVWNFLVLGAEHIATGPDHILFILGLLLVAENLKQLVKTLTGFTLAHSLTLMLTTLGVLHVNARWVDVFVALSIVYIGAENLFVRSLKHRFWIASGFGLVHGFAFASNLRDAGLPEGGALFWSLLSFNLGVEAAQVIVCAAAFPLLMLWKRGVEKRAKHGGMKWEAVVRVASAGVIVLGAKWLLERLFSG